jgi:hypothetical protein
MVMLTEDTIYNDFFMDSDSSTEKKNKKDDNNRPNPIFDDTEDDFYKNLNESDIDFSKEIQVTLKKLKNK